MSEEYLKDAYELALYLRLNSHASLGERIVTAALEIATLSNTTWANYRNEGFYDNLIKTHEVADRLMRLIDIVKYLELPYKAFDKVYEDTTAIYKMSRSSVNTLIKKISPNKGQQQTSPASQPSAPETDERPSRQIRFGNSHVDESPKEDKDEEKEIAREGNDTTPDTDGELPFEIEQNVKEPAEGGDNGSEEEVEEAATA
jgi:hypothetical protein